MKFELARISDLNNSKKGILMDDQFKKSMHISVLFSIHYIIWITEYILDQTRKIFSDSDGPIAGFIMLTLCDNIFGLDRPFFNFMTHHYGVFYKTLKHVLHKDEENEKSARRKVIIALWMLLFVEIQQKAFIEY